MNQLKDRNFGPNLLLFAVGVITFSIIIIILIAPVTIILTQKTSKTMTNMTDKNYVSKDPRNVSILKNRYLFCLLENFI